MLRGRTRRDGNEADVIAKFVEAGCSVLKINEPGAPDLVVFDRGRVYLIEVKLPKGKLRERQEKFHQTWKGPPIQILRTVEDVVKLLQGEH